MSTTVVLILLLAAVYLVAAGWRFLNTRQLRVVHCPATHGAATLRLQGTKAALTLGLRGRSPVAQCSLWPERRLCDQACLAEVDDSPEQCAFQRMMAHWYLGKCCVFCGQPIAPVRWGELKPSLLTPEGQLLAWEDVVPAAVYDVLSTHQPVCASCEVAETFRRRHGDLVTERVRYRPDQHTPPRV